MPFTIDVPFKVGDKVWVPTNSMGKVSVAQVEVTLIAAGISRDGPFLQIHCFGNYREIVEEHEVFLTEEAAVRFVSARRIAELEAELAKLREGA